MNTIFIHYYCTSISHDIYSELLKDIFDSGLYDNVGSIVVNVVGGDYQSEIKKIDNKHDKIKVLHHRCEEFISYYHEIKKDNNRADGLEIDTIDLMYNCLQSYPDTDNVLYLHLKGAVHQGPHSGAKVSSRAEWRQDMVNFVIRGWEECISQLLTKDHTGPRFSEAPVPHYSGNFWWSTARHIKRNLPIVNLLRKNIQLHKDHTLFSSPFYISEFWLCSSGAQNPNFKRLRDNVTGYTDKNTTHSYIPLYEKILNSVNNAKNILEVGIGDFKPKNGESLLMLHSFFANATIYGIDILPEGRVMDEVLANPSIVTYTESNAYDYTFIKENFIDKGVVFDVIIDDGPHSLVTQKKFIELYLPLLGDKGVLIIEDVQRLDHFDQLTLATPVNLHKYIKTYDLRHKKGRYDDLVFTIDKTSASVI